MKKVLMRSLIIILCAGIIGIVYNNFAEKPLPLIRKPVVYKGVTPQELFEKTYQATEKDFNKTVSFELMNEVKSNPEVVIIDARSGEQFEKGHIEGAVNIHPYDEEPVMMEKIFTLPQDKALIIYCDGGNCDLSHHLAQNMIGAGLKRIFIYAGGWEEWTKKSKSN